MKSTAFSDQKRSSLTKDHAWCEITRKHIKTDVSEKNYFNKTGFLSLLVYLFSERPNMKINFHVAFVSTLFSNTTNVIEIFLHSCENLTLKVLYDVLGTFSNALVMTLLEKRLSDKLYTRIS